MLRQDVRILRADLASTAFGKIIIAVYGQIIKKGALSVNDLLQKWRLRTKRSKTAGCP